MTELYFLTKYGHLSNKVVYAGAAPGNHIDYLSFLFPEHHFTLVDPNPFIVKKSEKIEIINSYFTDDMCKDYKNCLFISDIRTADYKLMTSIEHE